MRIRVFHCDDSEAFTRLVAFWLDDHPDIEHVGDARTAEAAVAALPGARPDVVLLDTMGRPGDEALLESIRGAAPGARVIVYSGYVRATRDDALGMHADAYLAKGDDDAALVALIREVARRR
ncbi:response regulator [Candidatus Solirubrobacter pratensis]|uniref:response regulator n=1 Tax=Candidatus Solirubrobacter pratensis TaxID=1298857 RepID=UPI0004287582|nr:response regulator [Candidatus Solirubrobacter pratensis]